MRIIRKYNVCERVRSGCQHVWCDNGNDPYLFLSAVIEPVLLQRVKHSK